ncbi:dicarboxylate/amino acid:cation symporter [soil metagenome]
MKLFKTLYTWILIALVCGILLGLLSPTKAILFEPLATNFIKLIKIFIGPIVFFTIVTGIAQAGSFKKLGKTGIKAFLYFEVVSTLALLSGWAVVSFIKPGANLHANIDSLDKHAVTSFLSSAEKLTTIDFLQNIIPSNLIQPFIKGEMLQILFVAILFGVALLAIEKRYTKYLLKGMDAIMQMLFQIMRLVMYAAPLGVFGAMAFTVGKYGSDTLLPLLSLVATFYITGFLFVMLVLGTIMRCFGFSITAFLKYILAELLIVLGTSSSEAALPQLLAKLEKLGCRRETVGIVVPLGYSFNLDGTNIYITLAALFIAQALGIHLSFTEQLALFATAMLTSKGAAGVTGAGFITLAATLSVVPAIPAVALVLILGIDRFMSEVRALINFIGNGVAALVISRWEGEISAEHLNVGVLPKKLSEVAT